MKQTRRDFLQFSITAAGISALGMPAFAQNGGKDLVIAYNTGLPSWDPTTGPSAVNPKLQALYLSVFDRFIQQEPDLSFSPGLLTEWGFTDDNKKVRMVVREGVKWHDGSDFTAEDVAWSLERAGDPATGNPGQFVWKNLANFKVDGNVVTADVVQFEPTIFKWMAFLTGYVLPKAYYEKVGAEGFEKAPIGTGPYKLDAYERGAYMRLVANEDYWGGKPAFETVTIKFVPDAASRVAEIESGNAQVTMEIPYEEFDRLKAKPGLKGEAFPIADVGMIFLNDVGPMLDKNVRLAAHHAIDKQLIIDRLLRGYGVPLATLEAPEYDAFDPNLKMEYNPEKAKELLAASGYSTENPVKFTIQTTRGFKPKDYEMIQAIVGMWRKVRSITGVTRLVTPPRQPVTPCLVLRRTRYGTPPTSSKKSGPCGRNLMKPSESRVGKMSVPTFWRTVTSFRFCSTCCRLFILIRSWCRLPQRVMSPPLP